MTFKLNDDSKIRLVLKSYLETAPEHRCCCVTCQYARELLKKKGVFNEV